MSLQAQRGEPANRSAYTRLNVTDYADLDAYSKANSRTISQTIRWALIEAGVLKKQSP